MAGGKCGATTYLYNGEAHPCSQDVSAGGACHYHGKMFDDLIAPQEVPCSRWAVMDEFPGVAFVSFLVGEGEEAIIYLHVPENPDDLGPYDPATHGDVERTKGILVTA